MINWVDHPEPFLFEILCDCNIRRGTETPHGTGGKFKKIRAIYQKSVTNNSNLPLTKEKWSKASVKIIATSTCLHSYFSGGGKGVLYWNANFIGTWVMLLGATKRKGYKHERWWSSRAGSLISFHFCLINFYFSATPNPLLGLTCDSNASKLEHLSQMNSHPTRAEVRVCVSV